MIDKPKAIVLGGTNPHIELVSNLKARGYLTVLIDYYEKPPAKHVADIHLRESTLDKERVLEISRQLDAKLVISTCIDQAGFVACYVAEKLGLPAPYSFDTASKVTNKVLMKSIMCENGIPTSKYLVVESVGEIANESIRFPVVVKPADSNSSKGVRKADSMDELKTFLKSALEISRNSKAIVEEFVKGDEIGMDCFVQSEHAHIIMMHRKRKPQDKTGAVIYSIGSVSPPKLTPSAKAKLQQIANRIAQVFCLNNTPLLIQAIVNGEEVSIVEFAPRIGGGLNYRTINLFTGFDIIDSAVDSYLGKPVEVKYQQPNFFHSENHIYTKPGVFGEVTGYQHLLDNKIIEEIYFNKIRGMEILPDMASRDRAASFFVKAGSIQELTAKIKEAIDTLEVFDINGEMIMKKDIYRDLLI